MEINGRPLQTTEYRGTMRRLSAEKGADESLT